MEHIPEPSISVLIPVYNSQDTLFHIVDRLKPVLQENGSRYEIFFINDGSKDASWLKIVELTELHNFIRGINLMRNYGQHNALLCGIRNARYNIIVTMDDDLQNPPEELPKMLVRLAEGHDVVYGTPQQEQHGFLRGIAARITKLALQSTMGVDNARNVSAYRAFRTQLRDAFSHFQGPFISIDVLLTWGTTNFSSIPVRFEPRLTGKSNYTFWMLINHALNMITGFSLLPLQLASVVGFTFTLFGFIVLAFVVLRYLIQGGSVPGFSFLASVVAIFSGAQLFALGIIGEYLGRIFNRSMEKPPYIIHSVIGTKE